MQFCHDSAKSLYLANMQNDDSGKKPGTAIKRKKGKAPRASAVALREMQAIPETFIVFCLSPPN
jgi:hypothetical protein